MQKEGSLVISKKYILWEFGQEIYTPTSKFSREVEDFDYPYGGWLYLKRNVQYKISDTKFWQWEVQLGVTGDASGARWLQNYYHTTFLDFSREYTWESQVKQAVHLNFGVDYFYRKLLLPSFFIDGHFFSNIGTHRVDVGADIGLSFGKSIVTPMGANQLMKKGKGGTGYLGLESRYVFHDYMLSGNYLGSGGPFSVPSIPMRTSLKIGYVYQWKKWKVGVIYYGRSRDNELQPKEIHSYLKTTFTLFY